MIQFITTIKEMEDGRVDIHCRGNPVPPDSLPTPEESAIGLHYARGVDKLNAEVMEAAGFRQSEVVIPSTIITKKRPT